MILDGNIMAVISIFAILYAIFSLWQLRYNFNQNISLFNVAVIGFTVCFILCGFLILYQCFQFIFFYKILSHIFSREILQYIQTIIKFTQFILQIIGIISVSIIGFLLFRVSQLSANFKRLVQEHHYQQAVELSERRLKFLYRFFGYHYLYSSALFGIASFYLNLGKMEGVERIFKEALAGLDKTYISKYRNKSVDIYKIDLSLKISRFYLLLGNLDDAEISCQKVLYLQGNKNVSQIFLAQALQLMAVIQGSKGNINKMITQSDEARDIYQNWIKVREKKELKWVLKKIKSADALLVRIVSILAIIPGLILLTYLHFFDLVVIIRIALPLMTTIYFIDLVGSWLEKLIKKTSEKHEVIVQYYSLIEQEAKFYQSLKDFDMAQKKYEQVKKELSNLQDNSISKKLVIAQSLLNQASLYKDRGMRELVSLDKRQDYYKIAILNYDEALGLYQCINNSDMTFIPVQYRDQHVKCILERNITYAELVGIEIAESELLQAFTDAKKLLPYPNVEYAYMLIRLGEIYYFSKKYSNAEEQYLKAEEILTKYSEVSLYTKSGLDFAKARLYAAQGRSKYALRSMQKSNEFTNKQLLQRLSITSEKHRINDIKTTHFYLNSYANLVCKFFNNSHSVIGELLDTVLQRKAIGTEVMTLQTELLLADKYPSLKNKLETLTNLRREIAQKTWQGSGLYEDIANYFSTLNEMSQKKDQLEEELSRKIPELNLEEKIKGVNRQTVSQALPFNSVLIEIMLVDFAEFGDTSPENPDLSLSSTRYLAFVLHAKEPDNFHMINLDNAVLIDQLIAQYRDKITRDFQSVNRNLIPYSGKQSEQLPQFEEIGLKLRSRIFDPLLQAIGYKKQILISPDGNLTQIPFETLPTVDGKELINLYSISYLSAGRDILRFDFNITKQATDPIIIADPNFDYGLDSTSQLSSGTTELSTRQSQDIDQSKFSFARLPGTRQEGDIIAELLNAQKWLGKKALKQQFFKSVHSPSILHIATHGFFLKNQQQNVQQEQLLNASEQSGSGLENPLLRSGLALAGANWKCKNFTPDPEADNGILTAEEVSGLDLSATELVVLSACETGLGETLAGEGVFGLRRTFVLAGAKTLIMSLWQVPDIPTQKLMVDFYRRILRGEPRSEALRNAQLTIRREYPHPYFWGAFICQGYPGSIPDIYKTHKKVSSQISQQQDVVSVQQERTANVSYSRSTSLRSPIQSTSARLILKRNGRLTRKEFAIIERAVIGCFDDSVDLDLGALDESKYISHRHAVIWCNPSGQWFVTDLKSSNGTFVKTANGRSERVLPKKLLNNGDEIILGNANFEFRIG